MNIKQVEELVLQSLEHEIGGVEVYGTALGCAVKWRPQSRGAGGTSSYGTDKTGSGTTGSGSR